MAEYPPPIETLPIFDNSVFVQPNDNITVDFGNNNYLKYPIAQGPETLTDITVLGTGTFNNTIVQNNTGININQTDHTVNTVANNLRATTMYGDLTLRRPTTANGGAIGLYDVGSNSGKFMQIYQSGNAASIVGVAPGGFINLTQQNSVGTNRTIYTGLATGTTIKTYASDGNFITLAVLESDSGKYIGIQPNVAVGTNMPVLAGDNTIISKAQSNTPNTTALSIGCQSSVSNGIKIDSVNNITTLGQGGTTNGVYATSFSCDGTTSTITGPASFTSLTPPISSQTIPASTDSSNKIPTTAWVQSAIGSGGGGSIPLFLRGYKIASGVVTTPMASVFVNFNGSAVTVNDNFTLRFSIRYDYNTDIVGQSLYYNSYYGNLVVFPNRLITNNSVILLSGSINGNTTYTYNDATYAPTGRYIWTENYSNTQLINSLNYTVNPVVLSTTNLTQLKFSFVTPYTAGASSICALSVSLELINSSTSTLTISSTTSGFTTINKNF